CYAEFPALFSLYQTEDGLLARFGEQLLIQGSVDAEELAQFSDWCGARQIEGLTSSLGALPGWKKTVHTMLTCREAAIGSAPPRIDPAPDLRRVYEILCASDERFAAQSSLLEWMSDLRRRTRLGGGRVWMLDHAAVAAVTGTGCGLARIALVACDPARRGEGLASALVCALTSALSREGLIAITDAGQPALDRWYARLGFAPVDRLTVLRRATA
ncbi:MAG: GNAT family N-acetyltransferase, partial [Oscillospiraceae bacterium]